MVKHIIDILKLDDFYGISKNIDIAKGKHKLPESVREMYKQHKRELKSKAYK